MIRPPALSFRRVALFALAVALLGLTAGRALAAERRVALVVGVAVLMQRRSGANSARTLDDAKADARQVIERLGGQVYLLVGDSPASKQALADAGAPRRC